MEFYKTRLPDNFLLDITQIPGSKDDVCKQAIAHYRVFLNHPSPEVNQIAAAMVGNLTEYYEISHEGSTKFALAIPHLSDVANFMDSQNTPIMDIQSTARIKSLYSLYEKLLEECPNRLEENKPILTKGLAKDIIATRDVLYPRYQFANDPQAFYKSVYAAVLEFMDYIDELSQENPEYGLEPLSPEKQYEFQRPKRYTFSPDDVTIPEKDFIDYALEIKKVPQIYRALSSLPADFDEETILADIQAIQNGLSEDELYNLPLIKALKNQIKKESLITFRDNLEKKIFSSMQTEETQQMYKDYRNMTTEDFLYVYEKTLKPEFKDYISIISTIDDSMKKGLDPTQLAGLITGEKITRDALATEFELAALNQELNLETSIFQLNTLNTENFTQNYKQAKKIQHYASCSKDYMRYPKEVGYQSLHTIVKTPFGKYEKQFRTYEQHKYAETGPASHAETYKPYEKEGFHRLKVCTPLMPERNDDGDIITPIRLAPLSLNDAIKEYYHKDFKFFSGMSMEMFELSHPDDFDEAMLALSTSNDNLMTRILDTFKSLKVKLTPKQKALSTDDGEPR